MERIRIFCLPFAGGNKYSYRIYEELAPALLRIQSLEYPGRGMRIGEALLRETDALVEDLYLQIKREVDQGKYAIYGHSMGGLLAPLLARKMAIGGHSQPLHVFITGTSGPAASTRGEKKRYLMNKADFLSELKELNGSPPEVLEDDSLLSFFEPILRADFQAVETYRYQEAPPLMVPFTVITGLEENFTPEDIALWQKETIYKVDYHQLPGNHFFIYQHHTHILELMAAKLSAAVWNTGTAYQVQS